jgi:hypothetical protein
MKQGGADGIAAQDGRWVNTSDTWVLKGVDISVNVHGRTSGFVLSTIIRIAASKMSS